MKTKQVLNEVPERTFWTNEGEAGKFEKHYGHLKWIPVDGPAGIWYMKSTATQKTDFREHPENYVLERSGLNDRTL